MFPVDTRRHFNVDTTSHDIVRRRIDVETTSCVYAAVISRITNINNLFLIGEFSPNAFRVNTYATTKYN